LVRVWERLAVRLAVRSLEQPWLVPSAQSRGPLWEALPELRLGTRPLKRSSRQERRVLSRLRPEREPLAVRLPAHSLAQPLGVPSAQSRERPWAVLPELRLDTRSAQRSIPRRKNAKAISKAIGTR
jgi:hypothetical protein